MNKHIRFVGLIIIAFSLALISSNAWASTIELVKEKEHKPTALCYQGSAIFFDYQLFGGSKFELKSGFGDSQLGLRSRGNPKYHNTNWNNEIKSLKIGPCTKVILYSRNDFGGSRTTQYNSSSGRWLELKRLNTYWSDNVSSVKVLPYCVTDLCVYTPDELAQLNEVKNQKLLDFVYALSGEWWLSRRGKNYQIEITTKKNSSDFTAKYLKINNPSTFSGNVWFDSNDTPNIKFTQYDSSTQFTAAHTGKQVKNDRFEGDFSDNRGSHGVSFVLWR